MDIISRIKQFMESNGLSSSQFADAAGIPRPTLSQLLNGRNKSNEGAKKVSSDIIRKIHDAYPTLNVLWLLFGDGDMESEPNIEISEPQNASYPGGNLFEQPDLQDFQPEFNSENRFTPETPEKKSAVSEDKNPRNYSFWQAEGDQRAPQSDVAMHIPIKEISDRPTSNKNIQSIMVFYDDNSFEIFKPTGR